MKYIGLTRSGHTQHSEYRRVLGSTSHPESRLSIKDYMEYAILDYVHEGSGGKTGNHIPLDNLTDDMIGMQGVSDIKERVLKGLIVKGHLELKELDYYGMDPG